LLSQLAGQVLPGVHELIADLRRLAHPPLLGLLTGNIRPGARLKLGHYGLWDHFELGAFGDDHEDRNRLAVVARTRAGERLQRELPGDEILVIGDTPRDVECARAIDARMLAVATGTFALDDLRACRPTWAVTDLREALVKELIA
jgi:phosphoglycolate phosphatase-like HAD superfamily hydrolase